MTVNQSQSGGAPGASGGTAGDDDQNKGVSPTRDDSTSVVSKESYEAVKSDMLKYKDELRDIKAKFKEIEDKKLKESNDYKTYSEKLEADLEESKQREKRWAETVVSDKRSSAVREAVRKLGIREEALEDLDLLDLSEVGVEHTSTGRLLVNGADEFAKRLQKTRSHWFQPAKAPNINSGGGSPPPQPGKVTAADVANAEIQWKRKRDPDSRKHYEETVKSYDASRRAR